MNSNNIGKIIKRIRHDNDLTQEELAKELCVTPSAVSNWEREINTPDLDIINIISDKYNITREELLNGITEQKNICIRKNKNYKINKIIIIYSIIITLLFICLFFLYQNNKVEVYNIYSENHIFLTGKIISYKDKKIITIRNLDYLDNEIEEILDADYSIYIDNELIYKFGDVSAFIKDDVSSTINIKEYFNSIEIFIDDKIDSEYIKKDSILNSNIKIVFKLLNKDGSIKEINVPLLIENNKDYD